MEIYRSFILSNFELLCTSLAFLWSPKYNKKMEKVQIRTLRFVYNDFTSSYEELLTKVNHSTVIFLDIQDIPRILIYQYSNVSNVWFQLLSFTLTGLSLIICLPLLSDLPSSVVLVILGNVHIYLAIDLLTVIDQYLFM